MVPRIGRAGSCGEVSRQQGYRSTHSGASRCAPTSVRTGKAADVIGLYLAPPQHAAVFCVDEKTAIQALERLDPVLPLSPGRRERHGFEDRRHGTLSRYAALDVKTGKVQGKTAERHASAEFVDFLERVVSGCKPQ